MGDSLLVPMPELRAFSDAFVPSQQICSTRFIDQGFMLGKPYLLAGLQRNLRRMGGAGGVPRKMRDVIYSLIEKIGDVFVVKAVEDMSAFAFAGNETQMTEQAQVIRDSSLTCMKAFAEIRHGFRVFSQRAQNPQPQRRGQGAHYLGELVSILFGQTMCRRKLR